MTEKIELRFNEAKFTSINEGLKVSGYVNKTNQWSETLGSKKKFIEKIEPGTFRRAIQNGNEIHFLAEHDSAKILASTRNDSLTLHEDENGLFMEATIAPTSWGKDYHTLIKEGIIRNMSFGMKVLKDSWKKLPDGTYERSIDDLYLAEVSAVRNPAYVQTTIAARSIEVVEEPTINLTEEKEMTNLATYRNKLDDLEKKESRNIEPLSTIESENRGLEQFILKQDGEESRAMTTTNGAILIPTHIHNEVILKAREVAPIFARTHNVTPINGYAEIIREKWTVGAGAGFLDEMEDIVPQDFNELDKIRLEAKRVGTAIELSEHTINDSGINIVDYAKSVLGRRYGRTIENNILFGTGHANGQFEGILKSQVPSNSGTTESESLANITMDKLLDFYQTLNPEYHNDACWVMSRKAFNRIVKLKSADLHHYMIDDVTKKVEYRLFGFPVFVHDELDNKELNPENRLVIFANFEQGYATMNRKGVSRLRRISDDTTQALRGSELFLLDGYMDGKVLQPDAIRVMKFYVKPTV